MPARDQTRGGTATLGSDIQGARMPAVGDEKYLWLLVVLEALTLLAFRQAFKRHHGG